jgi:type III restriction enzyme
MKLKFKHQSYQANAVNAVVACFAGQPPTPTVKYRIDPGKQQSTVEFSGFGNAKLALPSISLLKNIQSVQQRQNIPVAPGLVTTSICDVNLDVEMETGTGKTYCYIKTMFELHEAYGWSKFIVVVPSVAIREGISKSFEITAEHFFEQYGKRIRFFIYNSKQLHHLEQFSSDGGINVMIINVQAFNARGQDARRIYEELDDFQSRRPIDVIKRNQPILIMDEPQKMEGAATTESLKRFEPLFILRYSATHRKEHNKIYRLDALDAYNQKLVKKISVRGIVTKGLTGTNAYLYLESIEVSKNKPPLARLEFEIRQAGGIVRKLQRLDSGSNLHELSNNLDQYQRCVISNIDAATNKVTFTNGLELEPGQAVGDVSESAMRRIQIRETIIAHVKKENVLYGQGIKVLSLFFIDQVAKYRLYDEAGNEQPGEYGTIFKEEYLNVINNLPSLIDTPSMDYMNYVKGLSVDKTHSGYFSIDKKTKRLTDPEVGKKSDEADDVDAYDLILKDKERLLSFEEPVRFIFSHSALREGWDNPNVFVICTLKHSDSTIAKRQEVGRGMRLCVNQNGDRMDAPATVHQINVLTVVASESYKDFADGLQREMVEALSARPRKADAAYFEGKVLVITDEQHVPVTPELAKLLNRYLVKNDYTDLDDKITPKYHEERQQGTLPALPLELEPYREQVIQLIDSVFTEAKLPSISDDRKTPVNNLNKNFEKKEWQALWQRINHKAVYAVDFESAELIAKCVNIFNSSDGFRVQKLTYTVQQAEQKGELDYNDLIQKSGFALETHHTDHLSQTVHSAVRYDLIGKLAADTHLTRKTITAILKGMSPAIFHEFRVNPEDFIRKVGITINEQKATMVIEHLTYEPLQETYDTSIFTVGNRTDQSKVLAVCNHIYDYVYADSANELAFAKQLDTSDEVVVYGKLPGGFSIPTPVGDYHPDWAISFKQGTVKHIYFVAETKGSMSSLQLREIEKAKIDCARKFFKKITASDVVYDVVDSYAKLMEIVGVV